MAGDVPRQHRVDVPVHAGSGGGDARARRRGDREHRLDLGVEPGQRPQPLQQREGRGPRVHPVMCPGARAIRHPGQCGLARTHPQGGHRERLARGCRALAGPGAAGAAGRARGHRRCVPLPGVARRAALDHGPEPGRRMAGCWRRGRTDRRPTAGAEPSGGLALACRLGGRLFVGFLVVGLGLRGSRGGLRGLVGLGGLRLGHRHRLRRARLAGRLGRVDRCLERGHQVDELAALLGRLDGDRLTALDLGLDDGLERLAVLVLVLRRIELAGHRRRPAAWPSPARPA